MVFLNLKSLSINKSKMVGPPNRQQLIYSLMSIIINLYEENKHQSLPNCLLIDTQLKNVD